LATLVLVGAGLCLKSFHEAQQVERGFGPGQVLVAPLVFTGHEHDAAERRAFYERLVEEVRGLPSIDSVSLADWVPLGPKGIPGVGIRVDGYQPAPSESIALSFTVTSPGHLATLRIPLLEGRDLASSDDRVEGPLGLPDRRGSDRPSRLRLGGRPVHAGGSAGLLPARAAGGPPGPAGGAPRVGLRGPGPT
jgi:hypothetical protein